MKVPKHLLNADEVNTYRNGVETYHVNMVNILKSYRVTSLSRILNFS